MRLTLQPPLLLLSQPPLMPLLPLLVKFGAFLSLLLHLLPFADRAFDTEGRDTNAGGILEARFILQFAGLLGRHLAFVDEVAAFFARFDRGVDAVGGMDCGDGSQACCDNCMGNHVSNVLEVNSKHQRGGRGEKRLELYIWRPS